MADGIDGSGKEKDQSQDDDSQRNGGHNGSSGDGEESNSGDGEPRRKRRRIDPQIRELNAKVEFLTDLIMRNYQNHEERPDSPDNISNSKVLGEPGQEFLTMPTEGAKTLELGQCKVDIDEKKILQPACAERLTDLINLQKFNSPDWKQVRYSNALKSLLASPGFCELKVNEELCYLNKGRDPLLLTERVLAGL